jgi:hypothetical protein
MSEPEDLPPTPRPAAPGARRGERDRLPRALARAALARPGTTLAGWLIALACLTPGLLRLGIDTSTDSVLDRTGPEWSFYQQSQSLFGGDELVVVAITGERPWDPTLLVEIERLTESFAGLEGVARVDSIASLPVIHVNADGDLELDPALHDAAASPELAARRARDRAAEDRIIPDSLVSEDGRTFAINLVLEAGIDQRHAPLLDEVHALADPVGALVSGVPVFRVEANRRTGLEILTFAPLTALAIAAFLVWMFRSPWAVLLCLLPGVAGVWVSTAAMGLFDVSLSISTMVLPSTVLALGCAYAMHVLTAASEIDTPADLDAAVGRVALPIALSGLTTVVGFLALTLVRIEVVWATGAFGAMGVLAVSLATLTLLPAMLKLRPLAMRSPRGVDAFRGPVARALVDLAERRRTWVLVVWVVLAGVVGIGLRFVEIETDATRWLPVGHPVRDAYESIRTELSGISPMNVVIEAPEDGSVLEPDVLAAIDGLTRHLGEQPEVGKAISVADPLRQLGGGFQGDPSQPLPETLAQAAQSMLLLEGVEIMGDIVTPDRRFANVMLRVDDNGSAQLVDLAARARGWWADNGVAGYSATPTGIMYEFARAEEAIAHGQLEGLAVAFAVISGILFAIFRWPRLALVALVPNALPLVIIFGCMGLLGVPIDAGTVVMGSLALGIAVDDTIHVTTAFSMARARGMDPRGALQFAFGEVLPAVVASTLMLTIAFGLFAFSEFAITRNLGWLTGSIMVLCLLADITLLGTLLLRLPEPPASLRT